MKGTTKRTWQWDEEIEAAREAAKALSRLGESWAFIGDAIARAFVDGIKPAVMRHAELHRTILHKAKRMTAYQRRAARLNARPRPSKRHGERRGVK